MQKGTLQANCVVCNLQQNPLRRPIASAWLPALLKSGVMWGIRRDGGSANMEERYLLESESSFELRRLNQFAGDYCLMQIQIIV